MSKKVWVLQFVVLCHLLVLGLIMAGNVNTTTTAIDRLEVNDDDSVALFLDQLGLSHHLEAFVHAGFDEVRYIKRMNSVDFRNLRIDHHIPDDDVQLIRQAVDLLKDNVAKPKSVSSKQVSERHSLTYGRLYIDGALRSMEYYLAHFGAPLLETSLPVVLAKPFHACGPPTKNLNVTGALVVAIRGRCSFLDKAGNMSQANASAIVIVNSEEALFRVSGGYALGDNPENVTLPSNISVVLVKKSAIGILTQAATMGQRQDEGRVGDASAVTNAPQARFIPLECGAGQSICQPLSSQDQDYVASNAMDSGYLYVIETGEKFEYVSSTFGGVLPQHQSLLLAAPKPEHACGMIPRGILRWAYYVTVGAAVDWFRGNGLAGDGGKYKGSVAMANRGKCSLGQKAFNVQQTGAAALLIVSEKDQPIQAFGAIGPVESKLHLPAIMVTYEAGQYLERLMIQKRPREKGDARVMVRLEPSRPGFAEKWLELAHESWSLGPPAAAAAEEAAEEERLSRIEEMYRRRKLDHQGSPERSYYVERRYMIERDAARRRDGVEGEETRTDL